MGGSTNSTIRNTIRGGGQTAHRTGKRAEENNTWKERVPKEKQKGVRPPEESIKGGEVTVTSDNEKSSFLGAGARCRMKGK